MPTFTIDGKTVPFEKGDTILSAAVRAGVDIPHYCWHAGLSIAANCRMCLVEIQPPPGRAPMMLDVLDWDAEANRYRDVKKPKLQPACQAEPADGMVVLGDTSHHVRQARRAVQEFLLLNHPVDCPICDQAGECRLQDYWLTHQRRPKRMLDEVVHKPKAVDFGPTIVYDAERCILCTRCIRFCAEVAKDPVLSVRERGNINEICVSPGRELDHPYSLMTEHVCPVGALTSKDFRFKARVWFLRSVPAVCQGCASGCNAWIDFDPRYQRVYRYRPRDNKKVNQFWMCDEGMLSYAAIHQNRLLEAHVHGKAKSVDGAIERASALLQASDVSELGILLSAQHSNEDNFALWKLAEALGITRVFLAGKAKGAGDDILRDVDKNPNSFGAAQVSSIDPQAVEELLEQISRGEIKGLIAIGSAMPVEDEQAKAALSQLATLVVMGVWDGPLAQSCHVFLPACSFAEAHGWFTNRDQLEQESRQALTPLGDSRPAWELVSRLARKMDRPMPWSSFKQLRQLMGGGQRSSETVEESVENAS